MNCLQKEEEEQGGVLQHMVLQPQRPAVSIVTRQEDTETD